VKHCFKTDSVVDQSYNDIQCKGEEPQRSLLHATNADPRTESATVRCHAVVARDCIATVPFVMRGGVTKEEILTKNWIYRFHLINPLTRTQVTQSTTKRAYNFNYLQIVILDELLLDIMVFYNFRCY
jgi:hypothetical protein